MKAVALTIREAKRPSGKMMGYRLVASVVNRERFQVDFQNGGGDYVQSHAEKYNVRATLDYPEYPTDAQIAGFVKKLKEWHNITEITWDQDDKDGERNYIKI